MLDVVKKPLSTLKNSIKKKVGRLNVSIIYPRKVVGSRPFWPIHP
jgi:hypothetical protein